MPIPSTLTKTELLVAPANGGPLNVQRIRGSRRCARSSYRVNTCGHTDVYGYAVIATVGGGFTLSVAVSL